MKDPEMTVQWIDEELRRQGDDPEAFRGITGALREHYASPPPGLDRAAAIAIPRLTPQAKVVPVGGFRWTAGRKAALAFGVAALLMIGFFMLPGRGFRVRDRGRQLSLSLGDAVKGLATRGSKIGNISPERVELAQGSSWFWVTPGGKGFLVTTPLGDVRVTGTCFGVTVEDGKLRVDVTEGTVKVSAKGKAASVTVGEELVVESNGDGVLTKRAEGTNLPPWVATEIAAQEKSWVGGVLPSVGVHQH